MPVSRSSNSGSLPRAAPVLVEQPLVGELALRVLVQRLHVGVRGRGVEVVVALLDVLAVVALRARQAEEPLLQDRILSVPERDREADVLVAVGNAHQTVLAPAVGARAGVLVRKVVPGRAVRAVVLAHRAPLPLGEVGPPALPVLRALRVLLEADAFGIERSTAVMRRAFARVARTDAVDPEHLADRPGLERAAARRVRRVAVGDLGDVAEAGLVEMGHQRREERARAASRIASAPPPRTRTHASTNAPSSQGHAVPWW